MTLDAAALLELLLGPAGLTIALLLLAYGVHRRWLVPGWQLTELREADHAAIEQAEGRVRELKADRDKAWKVAAAREEQLAHLNTYLREQAIPALVRAADLLAERGSDGPTR